MTILFGKLVQKTYSTDNDQFHLYRLRVFGGKWSTAVYIGENPPKALKSVEYQLQGVWGTHEKYGQQFLISDYERKDKDKRTIEERLDMQTNVQAKKHIDPKDYGIDESEVKDLLDWWER